jgi:serine/threonine protein kinase
MASQLMAAMKWRPPLSQVRRARQRTTLICLAGHVADERWAAWGYDVKSRVLLGNGAFGCVYRTRVTKEKPGLPVGTEVAIKELARKDAPSSAFEKPDSKRESDAFFVLNQRDEFVKMYEALHDEKTGRACLVFELCAGGSLASVLASERKFSNQEIHQAALRLLCGLQQLQLFRLVHRDIAPRNVFLRKAGDFSSLVIGDVGCAEVADSKECSIAPVAHMAPETLNGGSFSFLSDLFAVGCVLLAMVLRVGPKETDSDCAFWVKTVSDKERLRYQTESILLCHTHGRFLAASSCAPCGRSTTSLSS